MSQTLSRGSSQATADDLLDAAERCFAKFGVERTTMADVGAEAGVHRTTVYRYYADRDQLLLAVLLRTSAPLFARAAEELRRGDDVETALVDAVSLAIDEALTDDHLRSLFGGTSARVTAHLAGLSSEFLARAVETTAPALRSAEAAGRLRRGVDPEEACRWLMRISMSFLSAGTPLDLHEHRRLLRTYVTAAIFLGEDE